MTELVQIMAGAKHGGAEGFFTRLAIGLQQAGQNQQAIIRCERERAGLLRGAGIGVTELPFGGVLDFYTRWNLRHLLFGLSPKLVLTWMNRATRLTPPGRYTLVARLGGYYDLKYYRHCDHLIANTRGIVSYIEDQGWPAERVHYLPNFAAETIAGPVPRAQLATPEGVPLLLALGRLHPVKGFDLLLDAVARLPGVWLWLAGDGPQMARLVRQARELDILDRVRFLGWRGDTGALMAAADVFVSSAHHEPLGNTIIEAWAHHLPVVATDAEGPNELIRPGIDGMLVPRGNPDALAHMLRSVLAQDYVRTALAQAGYESYLERFSERKVVEAYRAFFAKVAA